MLPLSRKSCIQNQKTMMLQAIKMGLGLSYQAHCFGRVSVNAWFGHSQHASGELYLFSQQLFYITQQLGWRGCRCIALEH